MDSLLVKETEEKELIKEDKNLVTNLLKNDIVKRTKKNNELEIININEEKVDNLKIMNEIKNNVINC